MFGRGAESEALAAAWAKAKDGQRQLVLLAGEPGIGKTRLATEAALAAHAEGAMVLLGTCDEDVHAAVSARSSRRCGTTSRTRPTTCSRRTCASTRASSCASCPSWRGASPTCPRRRSPRPRPSATCSSRRSTGLLSAASQHTPIVLVLDDLHWAGAPELLLLKHILTSAMPLRLLVIGTYRDTDLTRTHPLTSVLADFRRETGVERLALHGLDEAAVVGAGDGRAPATSSTEPGIALARALHRETEGSPFFIGEILRNLTESGAIFQEGDRWTYRGDIAGARHSRRHQGGDRPAAEAAVGGDEQGAEPGGGDRPAVRRGAADARSPTCRRTRSSTRSTRRRRRRWSPRCRARSDRFAFSHALIRTTLYEELERGAPGAAAPQSRRSAGRR